MKPRNFPARKLARKLKAKGLFDTVANMDLAHARTIRTKKDRSSKLRVR